jgi:hypothetical protein
MIDDPNSPEKNAEIECWKNRALEVSWKKSFPENKEIEPWRLSRNNC